MANSKSIYVIHTTDADQHLGHLKRILDGLKTDGRIEKYSTMDSASVAESSFETLSDEDMVIALLTDGIVPDKSAIEEMLLRVKTRVPRSRIGEILVDNIPYEPEFIAFPTDLQPIRAREDMDAAWQRIENNLQDLYPKPEIDPVPPPPPPPPPKPPWKKYLPYILGLIAVIVLFFLVRNCGGNDNDPIGGDFKVTQVQAAVVPPNFSGQCPQKFEFEVRITVNGPGKVDYTWLRSDNATSPQKSLMFRAAGSQVVTTSWTLGSNGQTYQNYWQQLKIISPVEMVSNKALFNLECKPRLNKKSGSFSVRQTWSGDFDKGREVPRNAPASEKDFWFEARTATNRAIVPRNNAKLSFMNSASEPSFEQVERAITSNTHSEIQVNRLRPGRWVGVRTANGNYAAFTVTQQVGLSPGILKVRYVIWL